MSVTTTDARKILIPFDIREVLSVRAAAKIAGNSESTMRNWCEELGLGRRIGGKWAVSQVALAMWLDADRKALRAFHAGKRSDPIVISYFKRTGLGTLLAPAISTG